MVPISSPTPTLRISSALHDKRSTSTSGALIGGIVAGVVLLICVMIGVTIFILRRRRRARLQRDSEGNIQAPEKSTPGRANKIHNKQRSSDVVAMRPLLDNTTSWPGSGGHERESLSVDFSQAGSPYPQSFRPSNDVTPVMVRDPNNMNHGFAYPDAIQSRPITPDIRSIATLPPPPISHGKRKSPVGRSDTIESVAQFSAAGHLHRGIEDTLLSLPPGRPRGEAAKPLDRSETTYVSELIKARVGEASQNDEDNAWSPTSIYSQFSLMPTAAGFPTPPLTQYSDSPTLPVESNIQNRTLRHNSSRTMGLPKIPMTPLMTLPEGDAPNSPSQSHDGHRDVGEWWSTVTANNSPVKNNNSSYPSPESNSPHSTLPPPIPKTQPLSILKSRAEDHSELSLQPSLSQSPPRELSPPPATDESNGSRYFPDSTHTPHRISIPLQPAGYFSSTSLLPSPPPSGSQLTTAFRTRLLSQASTSRSSATSTSIGGFLYPPVTTTSSTILEDDTPVPPHFVPPIGDNGNSNATQRNGRGRSDTPLSLIPGVWSRSNTIQAVNPAMMFMPLALQPAVSHPPLLSNAQLRDSAEVENVHVEDPQVSRAQSSSAKVEITEEMSTGGC